MSYTKTVRSRKLTEYQGVKYKNNYISFPNYIKSKINGGNPEEVRGKQTPYL